MRTSNNRHLPPCCQIRSNRGAYLHPNEPYLSPLERQSVWGCFMWYDMSVFVVKNIGKQVKLFFVVVNIPTPFWARNLILPFAKTLKGLLWHTYRHEHVYFWSRVAKLRRKRNFVFTWKQFSIWSISKSQICTAEGHRGRRRSLKVTTKVLLRQLI